MPQQRRLRLPRAGRGLLAALAAALAAAAGGSDPVVRWSAELRGLNFSALGGEQVELLEAGFAKDIAAELGVAFGDVRDLEGRPGRVTLDPADPADDSSLVDGQSRRGNLSTAAPAASDSSAWTTTTTTATPVSRPLRPMRGIAYGALPCRDQACGNQGLPPATMEQVGYEAQWGAAGRDDLGVMAKMGANAVRLYHSLGLEAHDHSRFLDRAASAGLNVLPGFDTEMAKACPKFDCFDSWRNATLQGFASGFRSGADWHPAVAAVVLLNEPDFLESSPQCEPAGPWCRVKAVLSALDGVLAAEAQAGVVAGRVLLTATWSFAMRTSIDGEVTGPGTFGFQDIVAGIADPSLAEYQPRSSKAALLEALKTRWVHGLNSQAPWNFIQEMVAQEYYRFAPIPWFIGEYGALGQEASVIQSDLESMAKRAEEGTDFVGTAFFQYQVSYEKGGSELNFGLLSLGDRRVAETGEVCDKLSPCRSWPVYSLSQTLDWLPGLQGHRAAAVAAAWNGSLDGVPMCSQLPPQDEKTGRPMTGQPSTTRRPRFVVDEGGMTPLQPMRGICYGDLPCTQQACGGGGLPSQDMFQAGYEAQWGASGRDDLATMAALGANAVRLYHELGLGLEAKSDHSGFLDRAQALHLNVVPGYHTEAAHEPGQCPEFDCFETWKAATLTGFEQGLKQGAGWHPAIAMLTLLNEPDFFQSAPKCQPQGAWCRVKASISALDGVLAAEREAGVAAGRVRLTIAWSFGIALSIDGKVEGPGTFGFQDMMAVIANPSIAKYSPRSSQAQLEEAFRTRWVHGLNTQAPWNFVYQMVSKDYAQFSPTPWFVGEYGALGQDAATIEADLRSMQAHAAEGGDFLGAAFFQFQAAYWKGGSEVNFGIFSLGESQVAETGPVCDKSTSCRAYPVNCLSSTLPWLDEARSSRAQALATAWGGSVPAGAKGFCPPGAAIAPATRRLAATSAGTLLYCDLPASSHPLARLAPGAAGTSSLLNRLAARTAATVPGAGDLALELHPTASAVADAGPAEPAAHSEKGPFGIPWWAWLLVGGVVGCVATGTCTTLALRLVDRRRVARGQRPRGPQDKTSTDPGLRAMV